MQYKVLELAELIGGKVVGDGETIIRSVSGLREAGSETVTFAVAPYLEHLHLAKAGAILIPEDAVVTTDCTLIRVKNPRASFAEISALFNPEPERKPGVHPQAYVDATAKVDPTASIMALAYVGPHAEIGAETVLYPHTYVGDYAQVGESCKLYAGSVVREKCQVGDRVILQPGAVIGADGFGFTLVEGAHKKVPQVGKVIIHDDVEVGANSTIDRGTLGDTIVGKGTKLDNLVHLGHNVQTGEHCLFVALTGISGSTIIGDYCVFGGQSATKGHLKIGDRCRFGGRSGITNDIPSDSEMSGFPVQPHREWLRKEVATLQLPEFIKRVRILEKKLAENKEV